MKMLRASDFPPDGWDHAQICPDGHVITADFYTSPEFGAEFCAACGKATLIACPSCSSPIRGKHMGSLGSYRRPRHCHQCGAMFPWTARTLDEWQGIVDMMDGLNDEDRGRLKSSIDDIVADTPGTSRAILTLKMLLPKAGKEVYDAARTLLIAVATDAAKKGLGF